MSIGLVTSRALAGIDAPAVRIEVFLSGGLPSFSVSGMAETAVRDANATLLAARGADDSYTLESVELLAEIDEARRRAR